MIKPDIHKMFLYAKGPHKAKYQLLIYKRESTALNYGVDSKAFIEQTNDMDDDDDAQ